MSSWHLLVGMDEQRVNIAVHLLQLRRHGLQQRLVSVDAGRHLQLPR